LHASEKYTERVQKLRVEYWTTIEEVNLKDLVFIDEAGVNIAMTRLFARSPQGSRAYGTRPDGRGKNVTMIGAISLEGIIAAMTFTGGTNASAFETYVTQVLVPNLWPGATVVVALALIKLLVSAKRLKLWGPDWFICLPILLIFHQLKIVGRR